MKAQNIKLKTLINYEKCSDAIVSIENDFNNYHGGIKQWLSGRETILKESSKSKIKKIEARMDRLFLTNLED